MSADTTYIGLMSGTSLDGVDAALVEFAGAPQLLATLYVPFPEALRAEILALHTSGHAELERAARTSCQLAEIYAAAVADLLDRAKTSPAAIAAIGCHGQTVRHRPGDGYTIQLNNPALLAELTGISVVADFRSRDIAAGGQGAPLVPAFHAARFTHPTINRVILNIGGIANVTYLPAKSCAQCPVSGFDTGPGNMLLDLWAQKHLGCAYDADGTFSASGTVDTELLRDFLADPYFVIPPPKSTGRDHFHAGWLQQFGIGQRQPQNVQATLAELTAQSIAAAVERWCSEAAQVYVCGGGAHNKDLMARLRAALGSLPVGSTEALGIHPDWVEAMAFAWLAHQALCRRPGNLPAVTGASGSRILGAIYPV
jgi:anhydro-N-acetylmuramic acid kinase